jgi:hypothetical protein
VKRLAAIVVLGGILVGCGSSGGGKTEVLQAKGPQVSGLYFSIHGPSKGVDAVARLLRSRLQSHATLVVAQSTHGPKDCSYTHKITHGAIPELRKLAGQQVTVAVYGDNSHASALCQHLSHALTGKGG